MFEAELGLACLQLVDIDIRDGRLHGLLVQPAHRVVTSSDTDATLVDRDVVDDRAVCCLEHGVVEAPLLELLGVLGVLAIADPASRQAHETEHQCAETCAKLP